MSEKTVLNVEGMTCSNCAQGISRFLEKKGLKGVQVDFASGEVAFEEVPTENFDSIVKGINNLGYKVVDNEDSSAHRSQKNKLGPLEIKFLVSLIFTVPLLLHMFLEIPFFHNPVVQLILCLPVFVIGMMHFGKSAWASL